MTDRCWRVDADHVRAHQAAVRWWAMNDAGKRAVLADLPRRVAGGGPVPPA